MKLLALAALVAVCGAAKLDRTYLPPTSAHSAGGSPGSLQTPLASAKASGGSPGSLQTPFAGNSLNNGAGGLPKGSYTNDFQGVVVDAALAGTRTTGESGLGAPRISYGSTDSKVGGAAFRVKHPSSGFNQPQGSQPGFNQHQGSQQGLNQPQRYRPTINKAYGSQSGFNQPQGVQPSFNQPQGVRPSFNQPQGAQQSFNQGPQPSYNQPQYSPSLNQPSDSNQSDRPQAPLDRAANTVKLVQEVGPENYNFAFETDNGIAAEEHGMATNDGVMAEGGYSYTGDDGQTYTVTYVADENGYQPKGDHLPTPPPIPEEILKSLEQNAKDEAAGVVDDGMYDAKKYNMGGDYTPDNNDDGKYSHQSGFGDGSVTDTSSSGSFNEQKGQSFGKPNQSRLSSAQNGGSTVGQNAPGKFNHQGQRPYGSSSQPSGPDSQAPEKIGQSGKPGFANTPSGVSSFGQNGRPEKFDQQGSIHSGNGPSNQFPGSYSQNPVPVGQNGFSNTQNSFGQNANPGQLNHQVARPNSFGQSRPSSELDSQYPGQFSQNSANAFSSTQNGVNTFGQNAKPGKFDHQGARPSVFGQSSPPSGQEPQYPGQFGQNSGSVFASTQENINAFGQNAKPGKFDYQGARPSVFGQSSPSLGQSSPTSGPDFQYPGQFGQNSASAFASTQDNVSAFGQNAKPGQFGNKIVPGTFGQSNPLFGSDLQHPGQFGQNSESAFYNTQNGVNTFGQNAKPGKFDHQGVRPSAYGQSSLPTGQEAQYPAQFGQNSASDFASTQDGINAFEQNAKPDNYNYQGSVSSGFGSSNQLTGPESQNQGPLSQSAAPNEFVSQANNAAGQPSGAPFQTGVSPSVAKPNDSFDFSSGTNAYEASSFQGFGDKKQYLPPVNNVNGPQTPQTATASQNTPQSKPQSRPQDSGSSESSSSEENSSEEDSSLSNQSQQNPQKNSPQGFPSRVPNQPLNDFSAQSSFGSRPSQNIPFGNTLQPSNNNNFAESQQNFGIGNVNNYLPPSAQKPDQNEPSSPNQQYNKNKHAPGFQSPFPKPDQNQGHPQNSYPSPAPSHLPSGLQAFEPQQSSDFQKPQPQQAQLNFLNENGPFPSQQNGAFDVLNEAQFGQQSQSSPSSPSTAYTPQPDTGLTNPLEPLSGVGHTTPTETSPNQPQLGSQFNNGQYTSPASSSSSTPAFGVQPTSASIPELLPFGNQFQENVFGNIAPHYQNLFPQNSQDSQFAPSTQRPNYYQQSVSDESYSYNQPSQPLTNQDSGFPSQHSSFPSQGSSYPTTPSNQFERVTQSPSYPTDSYPNLQENSHSNAPVQYSPQGPINYPNPPTLPSASPTSSTQYQGNTVSGITQAAISSFPSASSTQASFNNQNSLQSRPGFNQGSPQSRPSFESVSSTISPQTVPQQPIGGQNAYNQESTHSVEDASETPVPTQQYQGELYDYSKPAQLPPAPENDGQPGAGQFGVTNPEQETTRPDSEGSQSTIAPQFGFQDTAQPQYGAKPSRPSSQSTLNPEGTTAEPEEQSTDDSSSQYGSKPPRPQNNPNRPNSPPSPSQSQPDFDAQSNQTPERSSENVEAQEKPTQAPFGLRPCCRGSSKLGQTKTPGSQNKFPFQQGFGFNAAQSTPSRPKMNSFAGQGETFDATRKPPPSFDENGYHY